MRGLHVLVVVAVAAAPLIVVPLAPLASAYPNCDAAIAAGAATLSCEILVGRLTSSGVAGDGHDINCLTAYGTLP